MLRGFATGLLLALAGFVYSDARIDYLLHCSGCHLPNGAGNPPEVPTLTDELGRVVALAGGREYLVRVPGAAQAPITNGELAAVINWVLAEFNQPTLPPDFKPFTAQEVGSARRKILSDPLKHRAELWRQY